MRTDLRQRRQRQFPDLSLYALQPFIDGGFALPPDIAGAVRPTPTYPSQCFFDLSLNGGTGEPIWQNASNTGWINAAGASV
jgi:hypothetical protein